uniref:ORF204 protein n=1 Tax=Turritis glabra TaxID=63678 RepID=A0A5H2V4T0_TURGL|nr:ORF204 protein [Turritis glabra]
MFIATPLFALLDSMDAAPLVEALELPHSPAPSNASSSEDSFGLRVLSEPWPITPDLGLESSMRNRILILEAKNSPFLLGKEKGHYWGEMKESLNNASEQREYIRLLDFENRDLQIRERKHSCLEVFRGVLLRNPYLEERAAYSPQEAFFDFLNERRDALDISNPGSNPAEMDRLEILFLGEIERDLLRRGDESLYIKQLLLNGD